MQYQLKVDKLRLAGTNNLTSLIQEATLFHIETILYTIPLDYYQEIKQLGTLNKDTILYSKIYLEVTDWLNHNSAVVEFLTELNLVTEVETVLLETVSFYANNYFIRVMDCFNISVHNRVVGIRRREIDKYTYLIDVITGEIPCTVSNETIELW